MRIFAYPLGDRMIASSRLRIYNIQPHIKNYYIGVPEEYKDTDILIIQKNPQLEELQKAKEQGAKVIFDIDDYYWDRPEYLKMVQEAHLVTTDTESKAKLLKYDNKNVKVIPDSLDWDGTIKEKYEHNGIVGWTSYGNNAHYMQKIVDTMPEEYTLRLITTPDWIQHLDPTNPKIQSRPWSLAMVDKYLAECDLGIYHLPDGKNEQMKGMHKLLKNWAIGLPTFVSPIPDYVKAMEEAGVGHKYLLHSDWKNDSFYWKNLKEPFDPKCRKYAFKYEAKKIAKKWKSTIEELISQKNS